MIEFVGDMRSSNLFTEAHEDRIKGEIWRTSAPLSAEDARGGLKSVKINLVPLKVRDMIKAVEADGWILDRFRGTSHRQFRHPVKVGTVTIAGALHVELDKGTEANIRRQAGIK